MSERAEAEAVVVGRRDLMATDLLSASVAGENVVLRGVDWETYLGLRDHPENDRLRMTYLDGTLILMSPEFAHEMDVAILEVLVRAVARALGLPLKTARSTTLRRGRPRRGAGKEPDTSFYLGANELRMRKKRTLDLTVDPPPDLAVEVDHKADSVAALPVYARLGVPEVWRATPREGVALRFYRLVGDDYEEVDRSRALPILTPTLVLDALRVLDESEMDENAWADHVEGWARRIAAVERD